MKPAEYYARSRSAIDVDLASEEITEQRAHMLRSLVDVAEQRELWLAEPGTSTSWLGLGDLLVVMDEFAGSDHTGGPYFMAFDVLKITAVDMDVYARLRAEEDAEAEKTGTPSRYCDYEVPLENGLLKRVPLCNWQMAMELTLEGAWGAEILRNMQPVLRRAAVESGIADTFGAVVRQADDGTWVKTGETLASVIAAQGVPTEDEVRAAVRRGPALAPEGGL